MCHLHLVFTGQSVAPINATIECRNHFINRLFSFIFFFLFQRRAAENVRLNHEYQVGTNLCSIMPCILTLPLNSERSWCDLI